MRNLQQTLPSSSPMIPGTPNQQTHPTTTTTTSSTIPPPPNSTIQASVSHLQAQNVALHNSMDSFQTQMQSQFFSFQQSVLEAISHLQQPSPFIPTSPLPQPTIPQLSFGSRYPISTTWTGLGVSNPPSSPIQSASTPISISSTDPSTSHRSNSQPSSAIYSTITSIPNTFQPTPTQFHSIPDFSQPQFYTPNHHFHQDSSFYKPPKVDLPRFNGEDVMGWLAMAERYIRVQRIPPLERVSAIASHFGPDASVWMNSL